MSRRKSAGISGMLLGGKPTPKPPAMAAALLQGVDPSKALLQDRQARATDLDGEPVIPSVAVNQSRALLDKVAHVYPRVAGFLVKCGEFRMREDQIHAALEIASAKDQQFVDFLEFTKSAAFTKAGSSIGRGMTGFLTAGLGAGSSLLGGAAKGLGWAGEQVGIPGGKWLKDTGAQAINHSNELVAAGTKDFFNPTATGPSALRQTMNRWQRGPMDAAGNSTHAISPLATGAQNVLAGGLEGAGEALPWIGGASALNAGGKALTARGVQLGTQGNMLGALGRNVAAQGGVGNRVSGLAAQGLGLGARAVGVQARGAGAATRGLGGLSGAMAVGEGQGPLIGGMLRAGQHPDTAVGKTRDPITGAPKMQTLGGEQRGLNPEESQQFAGEMQQDVTQRMSQVRSTRDAMRAARSGQLPPELQGKSPEEIEKFKQDQVAQGTVIAGDLEQQLSQELKAGGPPTAETHAQLKELALMRAELNGGPEAAAEMMKRYEGGAPSPEDQAKGVAAVAKELDPSGEAAKDPGFAQYAWDQFQAMPTWMKVVVGLGFGVGTAGILGGLFGGGGVMSWLTGALGLAVGGGMAAYGGMFGEGAQQAVSGLVDQFSGNQAPVKPPMAPPPVATQQQPPGFTGPPDVANPADRPPAPQPLVPNSPLAPTGPNPAGGGPAPGAAPGGPAPAGQPPAGGPATKPWTAAHTQGFEKAKANYRMFPKQVMSTVQAELQKSFGVQVPPATIKAVLEGQTTLDAVLQQYGITKQGGYDHRQRLLLAALAASHGRQRFGASLGLAAHV